MNKIFKIINFFNNGIIKHILLDYLFEEIKPKEFYRLSEDQKLSMRVSFVSRYYK